MKRDFSVLRAALLALLFFAFSVSSYGEVMGSTANAVNNSGAIAGARYPGYTVGDEIYPLNDIIVPRATLWVRDSSVTDLGTLPQGTLSEALAINNSKQVVGYSTTAGGSTHAFLWEHGVMRDLGTLGPEYVYSRANGINDRGDVVGVSCKQDPYPNTVILHNPLPTLNLITGNPIVECRAFLWRGGRMLDLGVYPGGTFSSAQAINNAGQVVGSGDILAPQDPPYPPLDEIRAFVWDKGKLTFLGPETFCMCDIYASAINNAGSIAGFYISSGANFALYWTAGKEMAIQRLGGSALQGMYATGINNRGQIVGVSPFTSEPEGNETEVGFSFENGTAAPLPYLSSDAQDSGAQGINQSGLIVGWDVGNAVIWENGVIKLLKQD